VNRFLTHLAAYFALICGALFVYGFIAGERIRVSKRDDTREFVIVVSAADADERYDTLWVEGCSAEMTDRGMECAMGWYGSSARQWSGKQVPVPFRDAPRGIPLLFLAIIADRQGKALVTSTYLTSRSF
jgi:hypothetical protein